MKVLFTGPLPDWAKNGTEALGHTVESVAADTYVDEKAFCKGIQGIDVYVSGGMEKCTQAVIASADKLKAIIFLGVDFKNYIDEAAAINRGIPIFNTPGANARAVAELTALLMLAAARKAAPMLVSAANKISKNETGTELHGKTLGILGAGHIARMVANIAAGFGMKVLYNNHTGPKPEMPAVHEGLDQVLAQSDFLSLHIPKDAGEVLSAASLAKLKRGAILINTSPARLVNADALYAALTNGQLRAAAFDSFYTEGSGAWSCPEARLFSLGPDKFFITPHAGWRTTEADDNMFKIALAHLKSL